MTQLDFQGTKLKDFKASRLNDRNFFPTPPPIDGFLLKMTQGKFFYFGFTEYASYNSYIDNDGSTFTATGAATSPGPGYMKYLTETIVTTVFPNATLQVIGSSRTKVNRINRLTGEQSSHSTFSPNEDAFDYDTNFGVTGDPIGATRTSSGKTHYTVDELLNVSLVLFSTTTGTLSDPWAIEAASSEAITLLGAIDILGLPWGDSYPEGDPLRRQVVEARAMYRGQMNLERPSIGLGGVDVPGTGDPRYPLPSATVLIDTQPTVAHPVEGGGLATYLCDIEAGVPMAFYAARAMVKATSPVCVTYYIESLTEFGGNDGATTATFGTPLVPFSGARHKETILLIECVALVVPGFLPANVARRGGARIYFRFDDPPFPSTLHNAPVVCYLPNQTP